MNATSQHDLAKAARIKDKFDRVLKRHIRRLLDENDSDNTPPYSLHMIACLLVLAEREKEITVFQGSPPERYTRQTFLKDLEEIGIVADDAIMVEIQNLSQTGYIYIGDDEEYRAREPATKFLSILDAIFPSMQGLSLIAYILQCVDEVLTGRKEMLLAVRQFDETLLTRSESVSKQRYEALRRQRAAAARKKNDPAAQKQREHYLEKIKALRNRTGVQSSNPSIVTTSGYSDKIEIRDLFPKKPVETTTAPVAPPVQEAIAEAALPTEAPAPEPPTAPPLPISDPPPPSSAPHPPTEMPPMEAPTASVHEGRKEDDIEKKIKEFEERLAMSCPICKEGKILSDVTEKGKTYYYCSHKDCNLVTWGKPNHKSCPSCKNPFLIEFQQKDGKTGLKCPRATCTYQLRDLDSETLPETKKSNGTKKVRKVAIRRKGGKKGTRRLVVRRKG